jgi:hypothetical protein
MYAFHNDFAFDIIDRVPYDAREHQLPHDRDLDVRIVMLDDEVQHVFGIDRFAGAKVLDVHHFLELDVATSAESDDRIAHDPKCRVREITAQLFASVWPFFLD